MVAGHREKIGEGLEPQGIGEPLGAVVDAGATDSVGQAADDHLLVSIRIFVLVDKEIPHDDMQFPAMCRWTHDNDDT